MKLIQSLITTVLLFVGLTAWGQTFSESRSVSGYVITDELSNSLILHWNTTPNTTQFNIYKRGINSTVWGTPIATVAADVVSYTDTDVEKYTIYEYAIERITNTDDRFKPGNIYGYSYLSASIEAPAIHNRGAIWVITTKLISDSLDTEITQLESDLAADGWNVYMHSLAENVSVGDVKSFITEKQSTIGCDAVYFLGHVPVPYSGVFCDDASYPVPPDGHAETDPNSHCGAWPADVYYGDISGSWTDTEASLRAKRAENNNEIGDGKFDQILIPGKVDIAVGRVDMSDLPLFGMSEVALTKRYLNKVHKFKVGGTPLANEAIIENNFTGADEGFSSGALADFYAACGDNSITQADVFTSSESKDYLLGYTCGAGWYTSCSGFGTSDNFKTKNAAAFNHIFGSFFGDWDITNNLMRASLATEKLNFNCMWSGRPKWTTHTLAIGESYADVTKRTQNNINDYQTSFFRNSVHIAMLGDPSLRLNTISPAQNIVATANANRDNVTITWEATPETDIEGYFVYRSHRKTGRYQLINSTPITELSLTDNDPYEGTNHYMVRVAKKQITGSGSYINLSLGINAEINAMVGDVAQVIAPLASDLAVYPTIAEGYIMIEQERNDNVAFQILNTLGTIISTGKTKGKNTRIDVSQLASGTYFVKAGSATYRFIKL